MVNTDKIKIMIIDRENNNRPDIVRIGQCQVINQFVYLTLIDNTGGCELEIRRRMQMARTAMTQLTEIW